MACSAECLRILEEDDRRRQGGRQGGGREAGVGIIGAKPNLYCEAIELVCGGSSKICILVERKSRLRVK